MYRLLLVDDESDIREGLQEVVDFASYGFEVVGNLPMDWKRCRPARGWNQTWL